MAKLAELTPTIKAIKAKLSETKCYAEVVEWLIECKVPPGPYVKSGWTVSVLRDLVTDEILGRQTQEPQANFPSGQ